MKISILYLYYDLLNLYGDSGNVKALYSHLDEQGINVKIDYKTINDEIEFKKYDIIYIGSGTDHNLEIALNDIKKYKDDLKEFINDNKFIFSTGNSVELFGEYIIKDKKIEALSLVNYYTKYNDERTVNDINYKSNIVKENIIGFENHYGKIFGIENKIIVNKNFFGTYIIGPIFIRNPKLCEYYVKKIIKSKNKDFKFKKGNYKLELLAYNETIKGTLN